MSGNAGRPPDPLVVTAFSGSSLKVSAEFAELQEVLDQIWEMASADSDDWSKKKAVARLATAPAGFSLIFGVWALVGEVNNGGFSQFYDNGGAPLTELAVEGFRAMNRADLAKIVKQSKRRHGAIGRAFGVALWALSFGLLPRNLEVLEERFYALCGGDDSDWLESSLMQLISSRP